MKGGGDGSRGGRTQRSSEAVAPDVRLRPAEKSVKTR